MMAHYDNNDRRDELWTNIVVVLVLVGMVVGVFLVIKDALASPSASAPASYPVNAECVPDTLGCEKVEVLEFRDKAVGAVYVDGVLSHCKTGFCLMGEEYTEEGYMDTPEKLMVAVGCPDRQDAVEALEILEEFKRLDDRSSLVVGERACTTMSYSSYYSSGGSGYSLSTVTVYAGAINGSGNYGHGRGSQGSAYSTWNSISTTTSAIVQGVLTFVETLLYGDVEVDGMVSGGVPMVFVPDGGGITMKADEVITWILKGDGQALKGTFQRAGQDSSKMQAFADMVGSGAKVMKTAITEYIEAGGPGQLLP
jgi:hypothetical protein